ncbi:class I SAM-dependent methyltransferase [Gimesia aquarii]|uniref:Class I SAM-dependent methyltransferase n=1 Tax=Gimesia aquarii TaxID=2527964 RepID=A0A517X0C6_9PLAN|nr:class I SAM-dependent methyltransferase [Gimesia aquarii]QDU10957.1 hypothetical protein V202x_43710 [Gimesia aquarii]
MQNNNITIENILTPEFLSDIDSWHGHIPFAFELIKNLKPKRFVELGTHKGDSYLAFCQAVNHYQTETECFSVDTWQGDEHAGEAPELYGENIYETLAAYHDEKYHTFSTLMKMKFDDALSSFEDGSIDLLHIDGLHTYEAVKHDFETWLPKLSNRGVILFHDTIVNYGNFGVWKLWDELLEHYPGFGFSHSYGLGVLAVGKETPEWIGDICSLDKTQFDLWKNKFEYFGNSVLSHSFKRQIHYFKNLFEQRDEQLRDLNEEKDQQLKELGENRDRQLENKDKQLNDLNEKLEQATKALAFAQMIVKRRDQRLADLNSQLEQIGKQYTGAQQIATERECQILELTSQFSK